MNIFIYYCFFIVLNVFLMQLLFYAFFFNPYPANMENMVSS